MVTHWLFRMNSARLTRRWWRTYRPAPMIPKKKIASTGLPPSTDEPPRFSPNMASHSETNREPLMNTQKNGSQSAAVTLGRSRKSRRNNQATPDRKIKLATIEGISDGQQVKIKTVNIDRPTRHPAVCRRPVDRETLRPRSDCQWLRCNAAGPGSWTS